MADSTRIDAARCAALAARASRGDAEASRQLVEALYPHWLDLLRASRSLRGFEPLDDAARDVAAELVDKLGRPGSRELGLYPLWQARNPGRGFDDWVKIVTANAARDYARARRGVGRTLDSPDPSVARLINEMAFSPAGDEPGMRPPYTDAQTARQLMEFASTRLDPQRLGALRGWLEGESFADIAQALGLGDEAEARKLVRAAVAVLRWHFGRSDEPSGEG